MSKTLTTGAFGGIGCHLAGLPPKMRKQRRHNLRVAGWLRRADSMPTPEAAPQVPEPAAPLGKVMSSAIAGKVSRFIRRVFGRKGGR